MTWSSWALSCRHSTSCVGTRVQADLGIVWDWQSWWGLELEWRPSVDLDYVERISAFYEQAWRAHRTVEFIHPEGDLTAYPMVLVPSLYLTTPAAAANLAAYVENGGTLVVSYFSGIVDEHDTVHPGSPPRRPARTARPARSRSSCRCVRANGSRWSAE